MERRDDRKRSASSRAMQPLRVLEGGATSALGAAPEPSALGAAPGPSALGAAPEQAGADVAAELPPGTPAPDLVIGRYALYGEVASGGMATVHVGRLLGPVGFARTVAIKRLHPQYAKDPEFVAMFLDEARLTARIRHPNVASTLDVVATEGELFVVMEYVAGESLARLLRLVRSRKENVPVPIAAAIMVDVLHGLHAAHEARDERGQPLHIVHRDVSPHNILVGTDGAAHLIDFGIAKARGRAQNTREGEIKGKLSYMPPEQLLGQPLDHRADVFAASIVFWEALTGRRLFQGTDDGDILAKVLVGQVDRPSTVTSGLSPEVDEIVLRGLARERDDRYPTARDMALAIESAMPLAPPSQVGSWVESLAGEDLIERTMEIARIEGGPSAALATGSVRRPAPAPAEATHMRLTAPGMRVEDAPSRGKPDPNAVTRALGNRGRSGASLRPPAADDSLAAVAAISGSSRRGAVVAVGLLATAAVAAGIVGLRSYRATSGSSQPAVYVVSARATSASAPRPVATTDWVPITPAPEPALEDAVAASAPKTAIHKGPLATNPVLPKGPAARVAPGAPVPPPATASSPSRPSDAPSCDPPYWIDPDGNKRYYRNCAGR